MRIQAIELRRFKALIHDVESGVLPRELARSAIFAFFVENPHLLMVRSFDEHLQRSSLSEDEYWLLERAACFEDITIKERTYSQLGVPRLQFRSQSGRWADLISTPWDENGDFGIHGDGFYLCEGFQEAVAKYAAYSRDDPEDDRIDEWLPEVDEILDRGFTRHAFEAYLADLEQCAISPKESTTVLWSPRFWTPEEQDRQRRLIEMSLRPHLELWSKSGMAFEDLNPSEFEDLVGAVLLAAGMKIHKVTESPQGGRDLIARGMLLPDEEPVELAVEVKHRRVVDRQDLELALHQNRAYPALLFVTSGRFTSGVFEEKALPENRLRLFLRDGLAIGDLVRAHFKLRDRLQERTTPPRRRA